MMRFLRLWAVFILGAALAAPVQAQPRTDLAEGLSAEAVRATWCAAVLRQEAQWYPHDSDFRLNHQEILGVLAAGSEALLTDAGLSDLDIILLDATYNAEAIDMSYNALDIFAGNVHKCEVFFASLPY